VRGGPLEAPSSAEADRAFLLADAALAKSAAASSAMNLMEFSRELL